MSRMGSHVFFNGMALGETNQINIEEGKTLVVKYLGLGDRNEDGTRTVLFELNGMRREIAVPDPQAETSVVARMAGRVDKLLAAENTAVKAGELLAVIK